MNKIKFTPGPWLIYEVEEDDTLEICADIQKDGSYYSIAILEGIDKFSKANAKLIISAPNLYKENIELKKENKELIETLERIEKVSGLAMLSDDPIRVKARSIIDKMQRRENNAII